MTHLAVTHFCTCEALKKTPKAAKKTDQPSSTTPSAVTCACGAAKFNLEQVSEAAGVEGRGQVVTICAAGLLNRPPDDAAACLKMLF